MEHRKPPKGKFYYNHNPGVCRQCGELVLNDAGKVNKRAKWHKDCLVEYKLVHWPDVTRRAVYERDKGKCAQCGHQCARKYDDVWHLDHIKPLVESQGDVSYWELPNLQTLCQPCHIAKTSAEATERAARKRAAKDLDQ